MMGNKRKPIITITIGDPAGIGPEIVVKSLLMPEIYNICKPVVIGELTLLEKTAKQLKISIDFKTLKSLRDVEDKESMIQVIDLQNIDVERLQMGKASAEAGRASIEYIERAVEYALEGEIDALVTAPINKKAIRLAGSEHIGHTEMLAALCGVKEPLTMFWVRRARIFFLTRHLSLIEAVKAVKKDRIVEATVKIAEALRQIGIEKPEIAIAALNPHASDEGLIGKEEKKEIIPAVKELRRRSLRVTGPVPADAVFHQALEEKYDAVLSLYHDQGHIAAKTASFHGTVSVTLGLPFIRTSVDHGTAYDIAGKGVANAESLVEAIKVAVELVTSPKA